LLSLFLGILFYFLVSYEWDCFLDFFFSEFCCQMYRKATDFYMLVFVSYYFA
jgi:hypothetical protein